MPSVSTPETFEVSPTSKVWPTPETFEASPTSKVWLRDHWRGAIALVLITALAAFFRFWQLDAIPPGFHYDEAYEALEAWRVMMQPGYHPIFFPGNFGVEPMFIYLTSLAFRLFGATPIVMRAVAAVVGTLTVPALCGLGRELALVDRRFPMPAAWLAACALAIMRWHITFSRVGIEPILVPLFLVLILWAFWRAWRIGSRAAWGMFGLAVGLSLYTYPAARLLPVLALLLSLLALISVRKLGLPLPAGRLAQGLLLAGAVAALVAMPMLWNWLHHPDQLLLRSSQIAVVPGGAAPGSTLQNLLASLAMLNFQGDRDPRSNVPGMPALDVLISLPFLIGLGGAVWRWKRPVFTGLLLAGTAMLVPTILSEYAPHFRRAVGETPVVALFIGLGLAALVGRPQDKTTQGAYVPSSLRESGWEQGELSARLDRLRWWGRLLVVAGIIAGSALYSAFAYFDVWGRGEALYYAYDEGLWEIAQYVSSLPPDEPVYLSPRPETDMTLAFAWREGRAVRRFDGRHAFVAAGGDRPATYIIILHEDSRGALLLRDLYPDAKEVKVFADRSGKSYAVAYRVETPSKVSRHPQVAADARWPGITLVGYDIDKTEFTPGMTIFLQLWWRAEASSPGDWTVFTHVLGEPKADGSTVWAGSDAPPGQGSAPTHTWAAGDLVLDEYQIALPGDLPPGSYQIEVGLYDPDAQGQRLEMSEPRGQDRRILGTIRIK